MAILCEGKCVAWMWRAWGNTVLWMCLGCTTWCRSGKHNQYTGVYVSPCNREIPSIFHWDLFPTCTYLLLISKKCSLAFCTSVMLYLHPIVSCRWTILSLLRIIWGTFHKSALSMCFVKICNEPSNQISFLFSVFHVNKTTVIWVDVLCWNV